MINGKLTKADLLSGQPINTMKDQCKKLISLYGGGTRECPNELPCPITYHSGEPSLPIKEEKCQHETFPCFSSGLCKRISTPSLPNKEVEVSEDFDDKIIAKFFKQFPYPQLTKEHPFVPADIIDFWIKEIWFARDDARQEALDESPLPSTNKGSEVSTPAPLNNKCRAKIY